jgi:hypothetical protein
VNEDTRNRERISIILGRIIFYIVDTEEGKIITDILMNVLREYSTSRLEKSFIDHFINVLVLHLRNTYLIFTVIFNKAPITVTR